MITGRHQPEYIIVALMFLFSMSGCGSNRVTATREIITPPEVELSSPPVFLTATPTGKPSSTPTFTPEPTVTFTPKPSQTFTPILDPFPDILFNLGVVRDQCITEERNQIWYSTYPYEAIQPILADQETDYNYPQWSPDGKWIAYIESKPTTILDWEPSIVITGTDTVWIMRSDGSGHHRVSDSIPSTIIRGISGCLVTSHIAFPPVWSSDGRYIIFIQLIFGEAGSGLSYSYYLAQVDSGMTQLLLTQKEGSLPVWISNNDQIVLKGDNGNIKIISGLANNTIKINTISFPPEVKPNTKLEIFSRVKDDILIGSFFYGSTNISPTPKYQSLWEINIVKGSWTKLININKETGYSPIFGNNWAALCKDKDIIIFNSLTWQEVGTVNFPSNGKIDCSSFNIISDGSAKDVANFEGSTDEKKNGIWIFVLEPGNPDVKLLLNYSDISVISTKKLMVFSFSFRP